MVFLDDVLVAGVTMKDHSDNLREVFARLQNMGLRIKLSKCEFFKSKVCYLGHIIDKNGLRPDDRKLEAIIKAPVPKDVSQLKAFLGLINYYGRFVPHLSSILHPLHELLKKGCQWNWDSKCDEAFTNIKNILCSDRLLAHYDSNLPVVLSAHSSSYGVGSVLAHRYPDGSERPICYASRTLNSAEKSYSQLDKEALAIYFGVTKNHQYLYGRRFAIRTDHKPLAYIFGPKIGIPQTAASRLQRYAARLAAYDFTVEWVSSANNAPADCLSRLPLSRERDALVDYQTVSYMFFLEEDFPVSAKDVAKSIKEDPILSNIYRYIVFGWPHDTTVEQEKPYFNRKSNLLVEQGCIVYNYRIVIPPKFRKFVMNELHEGHLGVVKMKNTARNYVYWPGIDAEIEAMCRACPACRQQRDAPPHAPLTPWAFPSRPWQRLHADFAEYSGKHYFVIVDAHSKWIEVFQMNSTTAKYVIEKFREMFARFGLPLQCVTDNGPPLSSREVKAYMDSNNIMHILTSPYRPQGNGAAENAVKTVKNCIKKACYEGVDINQALSKMLFHYRNCEHATTGVAPAVLMLGRRLRGRLDALFPAPAPAQAAGRVMASQGEQCERAGGTRRHVSVGDDVFVRNYSRRNNKWVEGRVSEQVGPASFNIDVPTRGMTRRHIDQIIDPRVGKKRFSLTRTSDIHASPLLPEVTRTDDASVELVDAPPPQLPPPSPLPIEPTSHVERPAPPDDEGADGAGADMALSHGYSLRLRPRVNRPR